MQRKALFGPVLFFLITSRDIRRFRACQGLESCRHARRVAHDDPIVRGREFC